VVEPIKTRKRRSRLLRQAEVVEGASGETSDLARVQKERAGRFDF